MVMNLLMVTGLWLGAGLAVGPVVGRWLRRRGH